MNNRQRWEYQKKLTAEAIARAENAERALAICRLDLAVRPATEYANGRRHEREMAQKQIDAADMLRRQAEAELAAMKERAEKAEDSRDRAMPSFKKSRELLKLARSEIEHVRVNVFQSDTWRSKAAHLTGKIDEFLELLAAKDAQS